MFAYQWELTSNDEINNYNTIIQYKWLPSMDYILPVLVHRWCTEKVYRTGGRRDWPTGRGIGPTEGGLKTTTSITVNVLTPLSCGTNHVGTLNNVHAWNHENNKVAENYLFGDKHYIVISCQPRL